MDVVDVWLWGPLLSVRKWSTPVPVPTADRPAVFAGGNGGHTHITRSNTVGILYVSSTLASHFSPSQLTPTQARLPIPRFPFQLPCLPPTPFIPFHYLPRVRLVRAWTVVSWSILILTVAVSTVGPVGPSAVIALSLSAVTSCHMLVAPLR